jgi:hypothetical protein
MAKFGSLPFNHEIYEEKQTDFASDMYKLMNQNVKKKKEHRIVTS